MKATSDWFAAIAAVASAWMEVNSSSSRRRGSATSATQRSSVLELD
jgi:hypothetical protein